MLAEEKTDIEENAEVKRTIRLLSTSKNTRHLIKSEKFETEIRQVEEDPELGYLTEVVYVSNNREPLTKVYNKFLDEEESKDSDFVMMIHSDVTFNYYDVVKHYLSLKNPETNEMKYDIVGLAGTRKICLSVSPLTWFTGSRDFENERYGKVTHRQFNLGESFFNHHHPHVTDCEVSSIDGLCFILDKKVVNSDLRFDERFEFDFYDLDFCLEAIVNHKFKVGVIIEPVVHESVGTSILKPQYLEVERKFRDKWQV